MTFKEAVPGHIRAIRPYQPGKPIPEIERELGVSIARMADNENPWGASPKVLQAIGEYCRESSRYPDDSAFYLRRELARRLDVSMDQILLGVGSSELLTMACRATLTADTEVLTSEGSFVLYQLLPAIMGVPVRRVPMANHTFDLEALARAITPQTRLIFVANPNNPTGTIVRQGELDAFMDRVPEHILVVLDEAYLEYVDTPDYPDGMRYLRQGKTVLIARTFSKAYGLAGLRVGYGITRPDVSDVLQRVRPPFNTGCLSQIAALAALGDTAHLQECVTSNRRELEFLCQGFKQRGLRFVPSFTNFILLDLAEPSSARAGKLLERGVLVRPMEGYGFPTMVRVSVGRREENERFLAALDSTTQKP